MLKRCQNNCLNLFCLSFTFNVTEGKHLVDTPWISFTQFRITPVLHGTFLHTDAATDRLLLIANLRGINTIYIQQIQLNQLCRIQNNQVPI